MSAVEPLYKLLNFYPNLLSINERQLLEVDLFERVCNELQLTLTNENKDIVNMICSFELKYSNKEGCFVQHIIKDIILSGHYTLSGIALYSDTTTDVLEDVIQGKNLTPSVQLVRRLIELHREIRNDLYKKIMQKIITSYNRDLLS